MEQIKRKNKNASRTITTNRLLISVVSEAFLGRRLLYFINKRDLKVTKPGQAARVLILGWHRAKFKPSYGLVSPLI